MATPDATAALAAIRLAWDRMMGAGKTPTPAPDQPTRMTLRELARAQPTLTGEHPAGVPEGVIEKAVKSLARNYGTLVEEDDMPYLEQYLHPDRDVLDKQPLRPSVNPHGTDTLEYRKPSQKTWPVAVPDREYDDLHHAMFSGQITPEMYHNTPVNVTTREIPNFAGLGNYKVDRSRPDYDSLYDVWDFNTQTPLIGHRAPAPILSIEDFVAKGLLDKVGKPYAVYERFPKNSTHAVVLKTKK